MSALGQKQTFRDRATCAAGKAFNRDEVFDLYFTFIPLLDFPPGIPVHLSAHQPQHQFAACERLNLRCDHESHSQNRTCAKRSRQIAIFRRRLSPVAPVSGDLGKVRCMDSNFSRRSLELRDSPCLCRGIYNVLIRTCPDSPRIYMPQQLPLRHD